MRKAIIFSAFLATAGLMQAQETVLQEEEVVAPISSKVSLTSDWKSNWFISAGIGPQIFFGDHDRQRKFGERISPALDIAVGKWITPGIGLRLMYSGLYAKGATQNGVFQTGGPISGKPWNGYWLNESKFDFMNLHADVMFDFCNIFGGYNPNRVYSFTPYVGLGFATTWSAPHKYSLTGNIGISNIFHISKAFDLNADIRATAINDGFDGDDGHRAFDGILSLTVGATYKFAPRGWKTVKEIVTVYEYDNNAVNELRKEVANLVKKNEKLEKQIANGKDVNRTIVEAVGADYLIYFPINVSELSKADRAQLEMCADAIKNAPKNVKFTIIGYADKATGTPEVNEILSRKRAESVRSCLVNEFNVPVSRLDVSWKGGVGNMFYDDPALSRVVIVKAGSK